MAVYGTTYFHFMHGNGHYMRGDGRLHSATLGNVSLTPSGDCGSAMTVSTGSPNKGYFGASRSCRRKLFVNFSRTEKKKVLLD